MGLSQNQSDIARLYPKLHRTAVADIGQIDTYRKAEVVCNACLLYAADLASYVIADVSIHLADKKADLTNALYAKLLQEVENFLFANGVTVVDQRASDGN